MNNITCIKCGQHNVYSTTLEGKFQIWYNSFYDKLYITCRRCRYQWDIDPLDRVKDETTTKEK